MTTYTKTILVTGNDISNYAEATKDPNKLHQGTHRIALGTEISGIIRDSANDIMRAGAPEYSWKTQQTTFRRAVPQDTSLTISVDTPREHKEGYQLDVQVHMHGDMLVAKSKLVYSEQLPEDTISPTGLEFVLTPDAAFVVGKGQGKTSMALQDLALGLISPALYEHGEHLVRLANATGKDPMYLKQDFTAYQGFTHLVPGETIKIYVNPNDLKKTRLGYDISAIASTKNGNVIYTANLTLSFIEIKELLEQLKTTSQQ